MNKTTSIPDDIPVIYHNAKSREDEGEWICKRIHELVDDKHDFNYEDIALLCRKHSCFCVLKKALFKNKIPYAVYKSLKYSKSTRIKKNLDYIWTALLKDDANVLQTITFLTDSQHTLILQAKLESFTSSGNFLFTKSWGEVTKWKNWPRRNVIY